MRQLWLAFAHDRQIDVSGFDPTWLALREPADHRSRNQDVADALAARFALRDSVNVVDLGCGTGSNLRAMAELLPKNQSWTLVDHDPALLTAARSTLAGWADQATQNANGALSLNFRDRAIHVRFVQFDLNDELGDIFDPTPDLVTAAAFFDLASQSFIERLIRAVVSRQAIFYTVLTYNGIQHWTPRRPADNQMTSAFNRHQVTDKGLGPAAGPMAPDLLADQFKMAGYSILEGDSPWQLSAPGDAKLIVDLAVGFADAVAETGQVDDKTLAAWRAVARTCAFVGHTDTLALPA